MVNNYTVCEPRRIDGEIRLDLNPLSVIGKNCELLNVSYSNKLPVSCIPDKGIQEVYLNLTLKKLREIDGDEDKQKEFLGQKTFALNSNRINIFIFKVTLAINETIHDDDVQYLHDLLCHPNNDILVPPIIDFESNVTLGKEERIRIYEDFIKKFIETKNATEDIKLAMTIPVQYPSKQKYLQNIFDLYKNENKRPDLFVVDFGGRRLPDKYTRLPNLKRIMNGFLDDPGKRHFYAFNLKPWKRTKEASISEEIRSFICGIHTVGPRRGKQMAVPVVSDPYSRLPKIFNVNDYNYFRLNQQTFESSLHGWIQQTFNKDMEITMKTPTGPFNAFNVLHINKEGESLSKYITEGDVKGILDMFSTKPAEVSTELLNDNKKTMRQTT